MKIAVLGGGVSGLSAARMLKDKSYDVTLYEKEDSVGGLARTRFTDGYLYDPYGGHIFNSKHKEIVDWVFSIYPKENWKYTERNAKIFFKGDYISYPFELSLCELKTEDAVDCVHDFILGQQGEEPTNFRDWLVWNFGQAISDRYMIPYNEKIWAYPLEKMETKWMQGKMPLPSKKEMISSMLLRNPKERKMPHSTFYYPFHGGIQSMVNAISEGLNVRLNTAVASVKKENGKWIVNETDEYDQIVSTIPLPILNEAMDLPKEISDSIKDLKYNSLTTILFDCEKTDITWLYIPSHEYKSHRVGYQSTLTPYANPNKDRGCAALEIIGEKFEVNEEFIRNNKILPDELGFHKILDYEFTEFAYVIHDEHYRKNVEKILTYFEQTEGFDLVGRWATWNYKNMDLCMLDAMQFVKEFDEENHK